MLFVGGLMSYVICRRAHVLCYWCLFVYSGVQYTLCCVFGLLSSSCVAIFFWIVHF
jgi:hypothetical protein